MEINPNGDVDLTKQSVINMAYRTQRHRRQFPPGPWVRAQPLLSHGWVQTAVDQTKFWQGEENTNGYFLFVCLFVCLFVV